MKKQLGDFTVKELLKDCEKHLTNSDCENCIINRYNLNLDICELRRKELVTEIEVENDKRN